MTTRDNNIKHEIYKAEPVDLIFLNKNKDYGSYQLRKQYDRALFISSWVTIVIFIIVTTAPLIYNILTSEEKIPVSTQKAVQVFQLAEPPSISNKQKSDPVESPQTVSSSNIISPVVKTDEKVTDEFYWKTDTTALENVYRENTLDVQIKYPHGWTFIDQNAKKKLDGVTFWGSTNIYNPPPYIHLSVEDKDIFNPSRFKYSREYPDYTIYYNEPVELSGQFTRMIYIRTETDVDYSLKLIMKGKEQFESFEPVFFGMLQTFSFGD